MNLRSMDHDRFAAEKGSAEKGSVHEFRNFLSIRAIKKVKIPNFPDLFLPPWAVTLFRKPRAPRQPKVLIP
jgi:hypothetical protein